MRPSSLGGGRILRRTLSVCPSVPLLSDEVFFYFTVEPSYERTSKIEKLRFSLMGQRHVCTLRHAQRAAYRTAISAAQILVVTIPLKVVHEFLSNFACNFSNECWTLWFKYYPLHLLCVSTLLRNVARDKIVTKITSFYVTVDKNLKVKRRNKMR